MNRRAFVTGLGAMLAAPRVAEAQQKGKVYRIGIFGDKAADEGERRSYDEREDDELAELQRERCR